MKFDRHPLRVLPLALALALPCGYAAAQSGTGSTGSSVTGGKSAPEAQAGTGTRNSDTSKGAKLDHADRKFIEEAAQSGMFEVQVAQLGSTKATDPAVKSFADTLNKDHSNANNELVQMANSKGVELPAAPSRGERRDVEKMGKLSGKAFDQKFVREVGLKDHEKDIKKFEKAENKVKDPDLKAWITKTLPTLKEHLAMAEKLPEAGKNSASAMGNR